MVTFAIHRLLCDRTRFAISVGAVALVVVPHDQRVLDAADRVRWLEAGRLRDRP